MCCWDLPSAMLTLTAMHPDGQHSTPSRHLPLNRPNLISQALRQLNAANQQGWGAYFAVGLRRPGLGRWRRGGVADVIALPTLFVDIDDPSAEALEQLRAFGPQHSCLVFSGGGYHAYWWLDEPLQDLALARTLLRVLGQGVGGDQMTPAQSLRMPNSINTKPGRAQARCQILALTQQRYPISTFNRFLPRSTQLEQYQSVFVAQSQQIDQIISTLYQRGGRWRGDWINASCPFPERHRHGDQHPSFGFNARTGYGFCHVCGTLLLKDLYSALNV